MSNKKEISKQRRKWRIRRPIKKASEKNNRPRLSVHRTGLYIYAQVINDVTGTTLVAASTLDADVKKTLKKTSNKEAAQAVGKMIADRASKAGIKEIAFDRGSYLYHGRVKALAEAAREAGLSF